MSSSSVCEAVAANSATGRIAGVAQPAGAVDVFTQFLPGRVEEGELIGTPAREIQTRSRHLGLTYPRCHALSILSWTISLFVPVLSGCVGVWNITTMVFHASTFSCSGVSTRLFCFSRYLNVGHERTMYRCNVRNLRKKLHQARWYNYVAKEMDPVERGVVKQTVVELKPKELIEFTNEHGVPFALQQDVDAGGSREKVATVARGSELLLKPKAPRWVLEPLDFELYAWQESLWRTLNVRPTPGRIVWCSGEPHSGKSAFITYLEQRLEGGVFSCSGVCKVSDCIFRPGSRVLQFSTVHAHSTGLPKLKGSRAWWRPSAILVVFVQVRSTRVAQCISTGGDFSSRCGGN